jgi:periplasmic protein TonB
LPAYAYRPVAVTVPGAAATADLPADPFSAVFESGANRTLRIALGMSILVHAILLLVHFQFPDAKLPDDRPHAMEVVLVNSKSKTRPRHADAQAQANLDGGGNTEEALRATTNLPAVEDMPADVELSLAAKRVQQLEQEAQHLMARLDAQGSATSSTTLPVEQLMKSELARMADLPDEALRVARLEAEIARQWQAYQEMPKRKFIGSRTHAVVYAEYVDQWRQKIEKVGTANYPQEARERGVFGIARVTVAIKADGTVEKVEIDKSSGSQLLDDAVLRIVQLATPFKPFPANVRREADILHITRHWSFTRSDLLLQ